MNVDDVINLLKEAKVKQALDAIDKVEDTLSMADALCDFASSLHHLLGKENLCESLLKQALILDKSNPRIHYNLGILFSSPQMILEDERNIERAKKAFYKTIELDDDFLEARYNLGIIAFLLGDFELAKKMQNEIEAKVGDVLRYRYLGMLFLEKKRLESNS